MDRAATATLLTPKGAEDEPAEGTEYEGISVASALVGKRPVVVDYVGLGTDGPHRYLNRTEDTRSALDAALAVQEVDGGVIDEDTKMQLRDYSQDGHATASALELAAESAPELKIASASAGAVPTDIAGTISEVPDPYKGLVLFGTESIADQANADLSEYLNDTGLETIERAAGQCSIEAALSNALVDTTTLTKDGRPINQLIVDDFAPTLEAQELRTAEVPDVPLLVKHSRLDHLVPFSHGRGLASDWCRAGHKVVFDDNLGPAHLGGFVVALPRIEDFTKRTVAGKAPVDSCWRL